MSNGAKNTVNSRTSLFVLEQDEVAARVFLSLRHAMDAGVDGGDETSTITQFRGIDPDLEMRVARVFALMGAVRWERIDKNGEEPDADAD